MTLQKSEEKKNIAKKHKKITFQILVENAKKVKPTKKNQSRFYYSSEH